ncbi:hypothetical protein AMTR_s00007p00239300 [Amborella trichopoda]|uniref:Malectin-like domain-containing protein n=1 Tax=Amborella trichopoda TaxID=13333 RepID=W1PEF7_AMBTC|nr:hypothetical protein AMTR_s00007p00239300 [Amborella trichopoda]
MVSFLLLLLLVPISLHYFSFLSFAYPFGVSYFIDSGGLSNFTSQFNQSWISDRFYTGGAPGLVAEPHNFEQLQERTIRFFPISFGKKNCYIIPVPNGRYFIRTFTVYDNYDSKMNSPSFDVSVEGTEVFSWRSPWPEDVSKNGAYSDLFAYIKDGEATVCFYSIATDAPLIGSLEIVQVDPLSYDSSTTGEHLILVNYGRLTCGSNSFGSGFSNDTDYFGRAWHSDVDFRAKNSIMKSLSTLKDIKSTVQPHDYTPTHLYQTALTTTSNLKLEYLLPVDTRLDYMVWFHFAEIDPGVTKAGQRVFDIFINEDNVSRIDIFKEVGGFTAFRWHYTVKNLNSTTLSIQLVPVVGTPLISGLENYALVPLDLSTVPEQVLAMRALKESLRVPDRMGWNGDPCAPSTWDAWEGVTCHHNEKESGLVITQLDLGSQGLKGYISEQISLLSNLLSLNLSSNSLVGNLPSRLGHGSLIRLDLSSNLFTGSIPDSLGSSNLQLVLLNGNALEGQVPRALYSIGVHGGLIDLSGNKGLCGVPSYPACPFFWEKGGLSTAAKLAIGLSCVMVICIILLLIYMFCIRKGRNDYDFGLPHDLILKLTPCVVHCPKFFPSLYATTRGGCFFRRFQW